jgi:hypothetical protein
MENAPRLRLVAPATLFVAEVALQVSGYRNVPLAWALIAGVVATLAWAIWPQIKRLRIKVYVSDTSADRPRQLSGAATAVVAPKGLSLEEKEQIQKVRHAWRDSGMYAANGLYSLLDQVLDRYERFNPVGGFLRPILDQFRTARMRVEGALSNESQKSLDDVRAYLNYYTETYFTACSLVQRINDNGLPLGGKEYKRIVDAWRGEDKKWQEALMGLYHRPEHGDKLQTFRGTRTIDLTRPEA